VSEPKVVIGLPVYNGQKFLNAAIESHLSQSFGDFTLVISDNGSTDATPQICRDYASKDSRVQYLRSDRNRGILWNHRRVMEGIRSPNQYFRWAAGDDIMEPGLLQTMVEVLDTRPEVEAIVPDTKNIDTEGRIIRTAERTLDLQSADPCERAREVLWGGYQMVIAFGLFRAGTLGRLRTRPDYLGWDFVFVWELALHGLLVQPRGPTLLRRYHAGAMSHVKTRKEMQKWVEPNFRGVPNFPHWTWAYERLRCLLAAPLSARDKFRISRLLARDVRWQRARLSRDVTQATRRALGLTDEYTF
jgi:glycosyltransferase involved in cell wall biosynthesis